MMGLDEFLGPVKRALLFPPAESARILDGMDAGGPPPPLGPAAAQLSAALGDAAAMLRAPFRPPRDTFAAFPQERGRFDMLRARWRDARHGFEMAQTRHAIAVWVQGAAPAATLEQVERAALALLDLPPGYRMSQWGAEGGRAYGGRDPTAEGWEDDSWPHWRDHLSWWAGDGRAAFVSLKAGGGPTREIISFDPGDNARWF